MKLTGQAAARFLGQPDPAYAGALLFGPDAMRISLKRAALVQALTGPDGESEMRLNRQMPGDLRKAPGALADAIKEIGFFPGQRVVLVEQATDATTQAMQLALSDWQPGDAMIVCVAGQLAARSKLRKLFETAKNAVAIGIYNDPPRPDEIEAQLAKSGIAPVAPDALHDLITLGQSLDPGDFGQLVEKLSLYTLGANGPVSSEDVANCAPASDLAAVDDVIRDVADGRADRIGASMMRLSGQGLAPTTLCIGVTRHFRQLHALAASNQGAEAAISRIRPPIFGPRRAQMLRQAQSWSVARLEAALRTLMDTDLMLRSGRPVPAFAAVERAFIRVSMMRPR